jgi:hypothetical protein
MISFFIPNHSYHHQHMQQPCGYAAMEVIGRQDAVTQVIADVQRPLVGEYKA